jgi:hypothetical protein
MIRISVASRIRRLYALASRAVLGLCGACVVVFGVCVHAPPSALAQADTSGVSMDARALAYAQSFALDQAQQLLRSSREPIDRTGTLAFLQRLDSAIQDAKTAAKNLESSVREKQRLAALMDDLDTAQNEVRGLRERTLQGEPTARALEESATRIRASLIEADKEYQRLAAWPNTTGMRINTRALEGHGGNSEWQHPVLPAQ